MMSHSPIAATMKTDHQQCRGAGLNLSSGIDDRCDADADESSNASLSRVVTELKSGSKGGGRPAA